MSFTYQANPRNSEQRLRATLMIKLNYEVFQKFYLTSLNMSSVVEIFVRVMKFFLQCFKGLCENYS